MCASVYHQFSNQQRGTCDRRVDTITQDQMDDRGIIPTSRGIARRHCCHDGCCIIPITGILVLLMAAVIVPMTGSRVLTAMMGERIGTGNPAGGTVNAVTWDWIDGAPLHHLMRESTAYVGVLIDTDNSMKWRRQKKRACQSYKFIVYSSQCQTFFTMSHVSW
jgi:hypothetical protein